MVLIRLMRPPTLGLSSEVSPSDFTTITLTFESSLSDASRALSSLIMCVSKGGEMSEGEIAHGCSLLKTYSEFFLMRSGLNEESNEDSPMPEQCRSFYSELMPLLCCGYLKLVCSTLKLLNTTLLMSSLWLRFAFVQIGIVPHLLSVLDLESDEPATDEVLHLFLEIVANCLLVLSDAHLWDPSFPMSVAKSEAVECGLQQLMRPLTPFMTFVLRNVIPLSTSSPAVSQTTIRLLFAILRVLPLFETDCDLVDCEEVVMTAMQALSLVECESGIEDFFSNVSTIVRQMDQSSDEHTALNESRIVDGLLSEGLLNEIEMRLVLTSDANYPPYMVTLTRNAGKLLGQNLPNRC